LWFSAFTCKWFFRAKAKAMRMDSDFLLVAVAFMLIFVGILVWQLCDDFKHDTRGLTKLPSKRKPRS